MKTIFTLIAAEVLPADTDINTPQKECDKGEAQATAILAFYTITHATEPCATIKRRPSSTARLTNR